MKTFKYSPTSPIMGNLTGVGIGLFMIIVPIITPFGIRIGRLHLLGPIPTTILLVIIGLILLILAIKNIIVEKKLSSQNTVIVVDDSQIKYPVIKNKEVKEEIINIADIATVNYDKEEEELIIRLKNDSEIIFEEGYFEDENIFIEFINMIKK